MLLKNNVEAMMHIVANEKGNFIFNQKGDQIPKMSFNHFVIVHSTNPEAWYNEMDRIDGFAVLNDKKKKPSKRKSKKVEKIFDEENEQMSDLVEEEMREEETDMLKLGEESVTLSEEKELLNIARHRKILNMSSTTYLGDNGWFLCPVYEHMDGLYPCMHKQLGNKKGYQLFVSKVPLIKFDSNSFVEQNIKEWNRNSMFILNRLIEKNMNHDLSIESVYVHREDDPKTKILKNAFSIYETAQRARIKTSNCLIDSVRTVVGQSLYVENKETLTKLKKKKNSEEDDLDDIAISEAETKELKIIDQIVAAYKKINDKAAEEGKVIRMEKTFEKIVDLIVKEEEEEAIKNADETVAKKAKKGIIVTREEVLNENKILGTKDYISSFPIYKTVEIYLGQKKVENEAGKNVERIVQDFWLWKEFAVGIKGLGKIAVAAIIGGINFDAATHSSSVLRYLGLDQVIDAPKHALGEEIQHKDILKILNYLKKDYENVLFNASLTGAQPLNSFTYDKYYKTDAMRTWNDFNIVKDNLSEVDRITEDNYDDIMDDNDELLNLVKNIWNGMSIITVKTPDGYKQVVKKRARNRFQDRVVSTYLDSKGNIKLKLSLGYNTKLKSRLVKILFDSFIKKGNEHYRTMFENFKERYVQRMIAEGQDPTTKKNKSIIFMRARRKVIQEFVIEMWRFARKRLGLPCYNDNWYDAKIGMNHIHNHGYEVQE